MHLQRQKTQREDLSLDLHVRVLLRLLPPEGGPNGVGEEERHHRSQKEERDGEKEKSNRGGAISDWLKDRKLRRSNSVRISTLLQRSSLETRVSARKLLAKDQSQNAGRLETKQSLLRKRI